MAPTVDVAAVVAAAVIIVIVIVDVTVLGLFEKLAGGTYCGSNLATLEERAFGHHHSH